jgi:hypothetical protein
MLKKPISVAPASVAPIALAPADTTNSLVIPPNPAIKKIAGSDLFGTLNNIAKPTAATPNQKYFSNRCQSIIKVGK